MSASLYVYLYASASVYLRLFVSVYPFASASVYLRLSIWLRLLSICLSVCVCLSHLSHLSASVCHCLCVYPARSVCRPVYLSIGRSVITRYVCLWPVCLWPVCVRVCDYAAKLFCAASYFLGAAPSKSPVKQHSDTNHSANVDQAVCRYLSIVCRGLTFRDRRQFTRLWTRPTTIRDGRKNPDGFVDSRRFDSGCPQRNAFFNPLQAIPKNWSTYVLLLY